MSRTYCGYEDHVKPPRPIEDVIRDAIAWTAERYPQKRLTTLLLNPCHLAALGTWQVIDGKPWQCSYLPLVGPREVRVGPVDEETI